MAPAGAVDTAIAQYAVSDGAHLYSSRFGGSPAGTGLVLGDIVGVDTGGSPLLVGESICDPSGTPACTQVVSAAVAGPLQAGGAWAGETDAVIVSYSNAGTRLWTKLIGTSGTDLGAGVASGSDGFYANVNLGADIGTSVEGVPISGAPRPTGILLKLQP